MKDATVLVFVSLYVDVMKSVGMGNFVTIRSVYLVAGLTQGAWIIRHVSMANVEVSYQQIFILE